MYFANESSHALKINIGVRYVFAKSYYVGIKKKYYDI